MNNDHDLRIYNKTLTMNLEEFIIDIGTGLYDEDGLLRLIKYLAQNKPQCLCFSTKILFLTQKLFEYYNSCQNK